MRSVLRHLHQGTVPALGRGLCATVALALAGLASSQGPRVQAPPPVRGESAEVSSALARAGFALLAREDLPAARGVFAALRAANPASLDGLIGLGRVHLLLSHPGLALRYARAARRRMPASSAAAALEVQALLRARRFSAALREAEKAVQDLSRPGPKLLSAFGSALFRVHRVAAAARVYRRVLRQDPRSVEAHLRLGSGLIAPHRLAPSPLLQKGLEAWRVGNREAAIRAFEEVLRRAPDHAIAHRLLGEALLEAKEQASIGSTAPEFRALARAELRLGRKLPGVAAFMPAYPALTGARRLVADRALSLFGDFIEDLIAIGGRHDLLAELERTTDAPARAGLRGRRTFDGRVWDDVRGIGGLRAATGIEALDEAAGLGFDTLSHELAHQVHLYVMEQAMRLRIRGLYRKAKAADRFLDYYAASNEAEYFGQGVEAFVSLGKRPCRETTHGHTRFELYRRDPELHDLIARLVAQDPLADRAARAKLLPLAVAVALRSGRPKDAVTAAEWMEDGLEKSRLLARARHRELFARSY